MRLTLLIISPALLMLGACHSNNSNTYPLANKVDVSQKIADVNKELAISDMELIERYFQRREWPTQSTGSGLVYHISKRGNGAMVKKENGVKISFTVSLLDGSVCYGGVTPEEKEFVVGMGKEISGLEEVLLLLREGDRAIIAIPPHLGHGLLGDESKIPPRSTIIYDLTLVKVLQNK